MPKPKIICPDHTKLKGKPCKHYQDKMGCTLQDHPLCEALLRRKPDDLPSDPVARTFLELFPVYRNAVVGGLWFADPTWRDGAKTMIAMAEAECMVQLASEMPDEIAIAPDMAPERAALSRLGKFLRYPIRSARSAAHSCAVCHERIDPGADYYDGSRAHLRAHVACVGEVASTEVAMVGVPTPEEVDDLVRAGKEIKMVGPQLGELWLVPAYTDQQQSRNELSYLDWRTLCTMAAFFPGSKFSEVRPIGLGEGRPSAGPAPAGRQILRCSCHLEAKDENCPVGLQVGSHPVGGTIEVGEDGDVRGPQREAADVTARR